MTRLRVLLIVGALALIAPAGGVRARNSTRRRSSSSTRGSRSISARSTSRSRRPSRISCSAPPDDAARDLHDAQPARAAPSKRQTIGEALYELAQDQIAKQGLPTKALGRWFPYVATLLLFIFMINLLGFIPLPLTGETWHHVPTWGIYAATSSLSVTLALALVTFVITHYEGIRWNGPASTSRAGSRRRRRRLLFSSCRSRSSASSCALISLSVRLFANMLAGHILILTFLGLIFIFESLSCSRWSSRPTLFYLFEVIIVIGIQAFIFATLSAIYIGSAIEPEH